VVAGWIFEENLRPFVEMVAYVAGYVFDEDDWTAIHFGVQDTDSERGPWLTYPFTGRMPLTLKAAKESGAGIVSFDLDSEAGLAPEVEAQLDLLFLVCETCEVSSQQYKPAH
jgi:hypothetical protein